MARHPPEPTVARLSGERATVAPGGWLSASFQAARKKAPTRNLSLISRVSPQGCTPIYCPLFFVWLPFQRSVLGRAVYAVGSSEQAAYMSGMPVRRAKFAAYVLGGMLASCGGLFLTFFTYSGEASFAYGNTYTLYSIAAVVLGGVSLFGGRGSAIGAIFGALAFRAIGDLLFVFNVDPLWQPLFQGLVLLVAVSIGSARLLQVRNRLELFA